MAAALARAGRRPGAWGRPPLEGLPELREWFARGIGGAVTRRRGADHRGRPERAGHRPARARPARRAGPGRVADLPRHAGHRPRRRAAPGAGPGGRRRRTPRPAGRRLPRHRRPRLRLPAPLPEPDRRRARPRAARARCCASPARPGAFVSRTTSSGGSRTRTRGPLPRAARRRRPGRRRRPRRLADQGDLAQPAGRRARRPRAGPGAAARHPGRGQLLRAPAAPGGGARTRRLTRLAPPSAHGRRPSCGVRREAMPAALRPPAARAAPLPHIPSGGFHLWLRLPDGVGRGGR